MAKALETNFFCLENPLNILHDSALFSLMKCRTAGLMTALMAARLEAKLDMRRAVGWEGPLPSRGGELGKAPTPKGGPGLFSP